MVSIINFWIPTNCCCGYYEIFGNSSEVLYIFWYRRLFFKFKQYEGITLKISVKAVISYSVWLMNKVQDDASISWRKRKKHFFVLSNSGKPIYSRLVFINSSHKLVLIAVHISFWDCYLKQHDSYLYFLFQVWRRTQACWFFSNFASNHFLCGEWVL